MNNEIKRLEEFYTELSDVVEISQRTPVSEYRNILGSFYIYGWDAIYGDGNSFYEKQGNYVKAMDAADNLEKQEELKVILEKIWEILPGFYEIHQKLGDPVPQKPEKWF